ncbi:UDP-N-acetyl-D-mannosamine dehydrogenase [Salmonella enterica subsp. enterica]|uniref:UDP-N-acetyl-D-mannosamine dehydrogenase n=1 Tax=Salmonella enterica I TaxID=59201 RepID=A0A379X3Q1_SALET|nr:UDP-N-acetyl-D-mannosamine dehydrogenase [Salmonella enterica subsp. enterica]
MNIAYCPERVLPGQVMVELIKNDRVIGGMTPVCSARASALYKIFLEGGMRCHQLAHRRDVQADGK